MGRARGRDWPPSSPLSIEPELLERLRQIRSNRREIGDAATLYLSLKTREARGRDVAMADIDGHDIESILSEAPQVSAPRRVQPRSPRQEHRPSTRRSIGAPSRTPKSSGANARNELSWFKPFDKVLEWKFPFAKWFVGGKLNASYNCLDRHLTDRTPQQGRAHLGGRARRLARAHLPDAAERGRALRQRAQEPRREGGRSRRDLHAAGARGGDRDARVRAHRRDPFGRVRRLLGRGAGRSD